MSETTAMVLMWDHLRWMMGPFIPGPDNGVVRSPFLFGGGAAFVPLEDDDIFEGGSTIMAWIPRLRKGNKVRP